MRARWVFVGGMVSEGREEEVVRSDPVVRRNAGCDDDGPGSDGACKVGRLARAGGAAGGLGGGGRSVTTRHGRRSSLTIVWLLLPLKVLMAAALD